MVECRTELFKYQTRGVNLTRIFNGRVLLADEMGLGKTLQALFWMWKFYRRRKGPVVIITPATAKWTWRRECRTHFGAEVEVISGLTPPRGEVLDDDMDCVYVVNYEILGAVQDHKVKNQKHTWGNLLRDIRPGLVILDECHYIKNRTAKRTRAVRELCRGVPHVIAISGTPLTNRPAELWSVLNILWPEEFESFMAFAMEYCRPRKAPWGWEFKGARNLDRLHERLEELGMIRRKKADVLEDLPAKTRTVVPIEMSDPEEYEAAVNDFARWLATTKHVNRKNRSVAAALQAEKLQRFGDLRRLAGVLKLENVIRWVEDFLEQSDEKIILFGVHKKVLKPLKEHFGPEAVLVDGDCTGEKRDDLIERFNTDPACRVFVGNIHAAGTAWSCKSASTVAFVEMDFAPANHVQAEDRIHGVGRGVAGTKAMVYYLIAEDTIEEDLCLMVEDKQGVLDVILDGRHTVDGLNVYGILEERLKERGRRPRLLHPRRRRKDLRQGSPGRVRPRDVDRRGVAAHSR